MTITPRALKTADDISKIFGRVTEAIRDGEQPDNPWSVFAALGMAAECIRQAAQAGGHAEFTHERMMASIQMGIDLGVSMDPRKR